MRLDIKRWAKILGAGFALFLVFLFITFPFPRLRPQVVNFIQTALQQQLGTSVLCDLQGFDFHFPLGAQWEKLDCRDIRGNSLFEIAEVKLITLPGYQTLKGQIGKGSISVKANAGFKSMPTHIEAQLDQIPVEPISPLISIAISKANPFVRDLKFSGMLSGSLNLPLKSYTTKPGSIDLEFKGLKLPAQSALNMIGLKELQFSKSVLKANLSSGKLSFSDASFISDHLSGKLEGTVDLAENILDSSGNLSLKWQIKKSDALMSSQMGMLLANAPCPQPDAEGFCTRKVSRLSEVLGAR